MNQIKQANNSEEPIQERAGGFLIAHFKRYKRSREVLIKKNLNPQAIAEKTR